MINKTVEPHPALGLRSVGAGSVGRSLVLQDVFDAELVALQSLAVTKVGPGNTEINHPTSQQTGETYV